MVLALVVSLQRAARPRRAPPTSSSNGIASAADDDQYSRSVTTDHLLHATLCSPARRDVRRVEIPIDYRYQEYAIRADVGASASREVVAAQAGKPRCDGGHVPQQGHDLDAASAATLSRFPTDAAVQGASVGAAAARAILTARADDGWNHAPQTYILPDIPGYCASAPTECGGRAGPLSGCGSVRPLQPFSVSAGAPPPN